MNRQQFLNMALLVALETYFFNDALMDGHYVWAGFFAYLLFRNFHVARVMDKVARAIDSQFRKRK